MLRKRKHSWLFVPLHACNENIMIYRACDCMARLCGCSNKLSMVNLAIPFLYGMWSVETLYFSHILMQLTQSFVLWTRGFAWANNIWQLASYQPSNPPTYLPSCSPIYYWCTSFTCTNQPSKKPTLFMVFSVTCMIVSLTLFWGIC